MFLSAHFLWQTKFIVFFYILHTFLLYFEYRKLLYGMPEKTVKKDVVHVNHSIKGVVLFGNATSQ